jgi:hypothetical protein
MTVYRYASLMNDSAKHPRHSRLGRWAGELLLVFVGVYAAFWLNNYQQHREEVKRRDLILATLEEQLGEGIASGRISGARQEREASEFQRALKAGEMPRLRPFVFTTDYSPGDIGALLQSGGVALLDVKTLVALRELESVIRWGLSDMARYQKLSDELIVPNLGRDLPFFYDPATKQLREPYEIYPQALDSRVKFAHDVERAKINLVEQMKTEKETQP